MVPRQKYWDCTSTSLRYVTALHLSWNSDIIRTRSFNHSTITDSLTSSNRLFSALTGFYAPLFHVPSFMPLVATATESNWKFNELHLLVLLPFFGSGMLHVLWALFHMEGHLVEEVQLQRWLSKVLRDRSLPRQVTTGIATRSRSLLRGTRVSGQPPCHTSDCQSMSCGCFKQLECAQEMLEPRSLSVPLRSESQWRGFLRTFHANGGWTSARKSFLRDRLLDLRPLPFADRSMK